MVLLAADADFPDTPIVPSGALGAAMGWAMVVLVCVIAATIGLMIGRPRPPESEGGASASVVAVSAVIPTVMMIGALVALRSVLPFSPAIVFAVGVGIAAFCALRLRVLMRVSCAVVGHSPTLATETQRLLDGRTQQHTGTYCRRCSSRIGD